MHEVNKNKTMLGVQFSPESLDECVRLSCAAISGERPHLIFACGNPHSLIVSQKDPEFFQALNNADLVVADGVGITMLSKLVGRAVNERITGSDYYFALMQELNDRGGGKVFFFGSTQEVLEKIAAKFGRDYPALELCGALSPPFREWDDIENKDMIDLMNNSGADVLWVGMTAPKQEKWVEGNKHNLTVPVIGSIGAVFDFYAGTVSRAPEWMCNNGLEWLHRFMKQPRRMWRRVFLSNVLFAIKVVTRHMILREP